MNPGQPALHDAPSSAAPVVCAACDHTNPPGARFCNACGAPVHLAQCLHCEAVNDRAATHCYKCGEVVGRNVAGSEQRLAPLSDDRTDRAAPGEEPSIARVPAVAPAAGVVPPSPAETPVHHVGVLTAPADEAELEHVDVIADRRARRIRRLRYAAAALLVLPSILAATIYGVEHQDKVEQLIEYTRVAVVAPLVDAAASVFDAGRTPADEERPAAAPPNVPAGTAVDHASSMADPQRANNAPAQEPSQADATAGSDSSVANSAR